MSARVSPFGAPVDPLTGISAARLGLYVHFPYCISKCPYCDFASVVARRVPEERYTAALLAELELRLAETPSLRGQRLDSVFIGGGTPSLWAPAEVEKLLARVRATFELPADAEITLEANPGAADSERFDAFRRAGVRRLSIGVQSFQPETLRALGRAHGPDEAERAFRLARAAGFDCVSMDFIYGVHGQSLEQAVADARRAVGLGPDHLSAYALTLDRESLAEEVPLARQLARGEVCLPSDERVVEMSDAVGEIYRAAGLERYEISNYAKPGFHSRHNALYWTGGEWLALGAGATGCIRTPDGTGDGTRGDAWIRWSNPRSAERWFSAVEAGRLPDASREALTERERFEERLAMALRLTCGVALEDVCRQFDEPLEARAAEAAKLIANGYAATRDGRLALTREGMHLHSAICARLM